MSTDALDQLAATSNMPAGGLIIAVDGPSGTGKSTVCRRLAQVAGARYLDTGAMYRVATLHVLRRGLLGDATPPITVDSLDQGTIDQIIAATAELPLEINEDPASTEVLLDG